MFSEQAAMALVSIIIPTYNRSPLVIEAIASVLDQTVRDIEVIVVDDGSTDDTRAAVEAVKDARLKYFYKSNGGVSSARNMGLAKAGGEYICFLDSDDLWPENFLSVMVAALESEPGSDIAYSPRTLLRPDGSRTRSIAWDHRPSGQLTEVLFADTFMQVSSVCFRRKALEGFAFDAILPNAEDVDAWLRLSTRFRYLFVPSVDITFRTGHGVATRTNYSYENCNALLVLERFYYRLGGRAFISPLAARRRFSELAQTSAKYHMKRGCRTAAVGLYLRAIRYQPWNVYLYRKLLHALLLSRKRDPLPDWRMPAPLPDVP
jgi:glycosyltransferase involved in cell wall biosynthesis